MCVTSILLHCIEYNFCESKYGHHLVFPLSHLNQKINILKNLDKHPSSSTKDLDLSINIVAQMLTTFDCQGMG